MGVAHTSTQRRTLTSIVTAAGITALILAPVVAGADTSTRGRGRGQRGEREHPGT